MSTTKKERDRKKFLFNFVWLGGLVIVIPFSIITSSISNSKILACYTWLQWFYVPPLNTLAYSAWTGLMPVTMWIIFMSVV